LIRYAAGQGDGALPAVLTDSLFTAYFLEGEDIGDVSVLERRAVECGLERRGVREHLASSDARVVPPAPHGIGGVPLFVFDEAIALSGAVAPDVLIDTMLQSIRE
jgi:predicted DsbA family dithiol-disulfide isomerase